MAISSAGVVGALWGLIIVVREEPRFMEEMVDRLVRVMVECRVAEALARLPVQAVQAGWGDVKLQRLSAIEIQILFPRQLLEAVPTIFSCERSH